MHSLRFMTILFILSLPLLVTLALLILISKTFRCVIGLLLTLKTGEKIEFLEGTDSIFLLNPSKSKSQYVTNIVCQGEMDFEAIRSCILNSFKSDCYNHSTFFKYPDKCCGYYYWKKEENFVIDDHLILHKCKPPSTIAELARIQSEIINWQLESPGKSPWKIVVFPLDKNYEEFAEEQPGYTIVIVLNHSITDGYGILHFIMYTFTDHKPTESLQKTRSIIQICKEFMTAFFYAPTLMYDEATRRNKNILHQVPQMGENILNFSQSIALDRLKNIRSQTGTTINDIVTSCTIGAIEKHFQHENVPLPKEMHCNIPISMQKSQSATLNNNLSGVMLKVPLNISSPLIRLIAVHNEMKILKTSPERLSSYFLQVCTLNQLPSYLTRAGIGDANATFVISNVGIPQKIKFKKELSKFFHIFIYNGHDFEVGLGICVTGLNGNIKFSISSDKTVFANYDILVRFLNDVMEEIELLEKTVADNTATK